MTGTETVPGTAYPPWAIILISTDFSPSSMVPCEHQPVPEILTATSGS